MQIDLIDVKKYSRFNYGYNWIITCIDIFTRYAFTIAVKRKTATDVLKGFKKIMKEFYENLINILKKLKLMKVKNFKIKNLMLMLMK